MKFSIIVPIYKVEDCLERCIKSLLCQTYKDYEIILVDDGSPDNCPKICDDYHQNYKSVEVIHKLNGGLSDARNAGLRTAKGDYVLFVDSDDEIKSTALEEFAKFINLADCVDIAIGLLENNDGRLYSTYPNAVTGKIYSGLTYYKQFRKSILYCAVASVYRKEFLLSNNLTFVVGKYHEDNDFTPRAYMLANKVVFTDNVFYTRYVRNDSITTHVDKRKNLIDIIDISYSMLEFSQSIHDKTAKKLLLNSICKDYLSMFYAANVYQYKDDIYGKYIKKKLIIKTAKSFATLCKGFLFIVSPRMYIKINSISKHLK